MVAGGFEVVGGEFFDEFAGGATAGAAVFEAVGAVGHGEVFSRPRDADVEEAAFLVEGAFQFAAGVGEDAVFEADEVDVAEFEAFGGTKALSRPVRQLAKTNNQPMAKLQF